MAKTATVQEDFKAYVRAKKTESPTPVEFKSGEVVNILKVWDGELCLIKNKDGKAFNIRKALLNKDAFEAKGPKEEVKGRRKRSTAMAETMELSVLRPELDMVRGLSSPLGEAARRSLVRTTSAFFHNPVGLGLTALVVLLGIYLGWINLGKMMNETSSARLAASVVSGGTLHEPGHFEPPYYALKVAVNGSEGEVFVENSFYKRTVLTLKVPGHRDQPLATAQEAHWENNPLLSSHIYNEYVDVGADGTVDQFVQVKEFRSDTKKLVAAFRRAFPMGVAQVEGYQEAVQQVLRALAEVQTEPEGEVPLPQ